MFIGMILIKINTSCIAQMEDIMKNFIVLVVFATIVSVASYFTAKMMVKKRILFAKMFKIIPEQVEEIENMKRICKEILYEMIIPPYQYREGAWNGYFITVSNENHQSLVKVENDAVGVWVKDDGTEKAIYKFLTEKLATKVITAMIAILLAIISLIVIGVFALAV